MNFIGLDLSSKTGFVKLSPGGEVLEELEIHIDYNTVKGMDDAIGYIDGLIDDGDYVALEGFSYGSKGKSVDKQYGLGWLVRVYLYRAGIENVIIPPSTLKKFAGAKGNAKKDALAVDIFKQWGYEHPSDNVRDAFILARIARGIHCHSELKKYQQEAIQSVLRKDDK